MKKIIFTVLVLTFVLFCCGCTDTAEIQEDTRSEVIVYSPTGKSINGYREFDNATSVNTETTDTNGISYIANKNSKKFHKSTCGNAKTIKEENRLETANRQELINSGYSPCQNCNP